MAQDNDNGEGKPGIKNKGLLITALVLAVIVVIIYNVHVAHVRSAARGETVKLLKYNKYLTLGHEIEAEEDIRTVTVPEDVYDVLPNPVPSTKKSFLDGERLTRNVNKGQYVLWGHVTGGGEDRPSYNIPKNMSAVTIEVDPDKAPGTVLSWGDRVDVLAVLPVGDTYTTCRVIENVPVLAIGGQYPREEYQPRGTRSGVKVPRTYKSITLQMDPELAKKLENVLSHKKGAAWIYVNSSKESSLSKPRINPTLEPLTERASTGGGGFRR